MVEFRFPFVDSPLDHPSLDFLLDNNVDTLFCSTNPAYIPLRSSESVSMAALFAVDSEQPPLYRLGIGPGRRGLMAPPGLMPSSPVVGSDGRGPVPP